MSHRRVIGNYVFFDDGDPNGTTSITRSSPEGSQELKMPTNYLIEYAGQVLRDDHIGAVEQKSGTEFLMP